MWVTRDLFERYHYNIAYYMKLLVTNELTVNGQKTFGDIREIVTNTDMLLLLVNLPVSCRCSLDRGDSLVSSKPQI